MVVGNPYRLSVDCWCECVKELVLACCHNSGFSMPELSVPRFGPVFGAVYSVLKRWPACAHAHVSVGCGRATSTGYAGPRQLLGYARVGLPSGHGWMHFYFYFLFSARGTYASLEPGPSRARYFPRDMLLLTTTARESLSLSRAVVVNSNMSRGKYLAREGPGSRLNLCLPSKRAGS